MRGVEANRTTWRAPTAYQSEAAGWRSAIPPFFRRQPEFVLIGAVVGGALLAFLATRGRQSSAQQPPFGQGYPGPHSRIQNDEPRWRNPSARMGATEGQMEDLATPSARALDAGSAGATGAAYELDPTSITSG